MVALRIPCATYRTQLNPNFRFTDARDLIPYLHELGITDHYASPRFKARKGSSHGYDVADPLRVNSELGTEEEFEELVEKLKSYGMGILLDIVPNHMAASSENPWWMDVLENGPSSPYAAYFDIDWHPAISKAAFLQENRVLLPVLGDLYGNVLENQEFSLKLDEKGFFVRYNEVRLPLDPKSYGAILEECRRASSRASAHFMEELDAILEAVARLPARTATDIAEIEPRRRGKEQIIERAWRLYQADEESKGVFDETLRLLNGTRGDPGSFDRLDRLLSDQAYRVAYWKIATEEINYRRFFDVSDLVGLRLEDPRVFDAWHVHVLQLIKEREVSALRVDHIDGLYDPLGYLRRLQSAAATALGAPENSQALYVVVEKILGVNERLPEEWPVCGTTGYDFLDQVNGVFIDPKGFHALEEIYSQFTQSKISFSYVCYTRNKQVIEQLFAGETKALGNQLGRLAAQDRRARDVPLSELLQALVEVTACLPVYRTYIRSFDVAASDRAYLERSLEAARRLTLRQRVSDDAFAFLRRVLLLQPPSDGEGQREEWLRFVMRWQQFTGPVMAKGLEDTAFYVHNSLVSLNEVGGDPLRKDLPLDLEAFHVFNQERLAHWPYTLNATSTHDTKRSEDVRARINVLSELPEEWRTCLERWSRWNQAKKRTVYGQLAPDRNDEILLYQTMLGAFPLLSAERAGFVERLATYMEKAAREAKVHTSWLNPDAEYERALQEFVHSLLDDSEKNRFLSDFLRFQRQIAHYGAWNALAQVLLKIASPGVPDFYQGTELWDLSLVDPDNRRPVDFQQRVRLLEELESRGPQGLGSLARDLAQRWPDGGVKLFLIWRALNFRRSHKELFLKGEYVPLYAAGQKRENVCAFARRVGGDWALVAVPRLPTKLVHRDAPPIGIETWGQSTLGLPREAPPCWSNVFTGETLKSSRTRREEALRLHAVFHNFPVALLAGTSPNSGKTLSHDG